jgi:hypothetical protein
VHYLFFPPVAVMNRSSRPGRMISFGIGLPTDGGSSLGLTATARGGGVCSPDIP